MSRDRGSPELTAGPIMWIVLAGFPKSEGGTRVLFDEGKLRMTLPRMLLIGILLNAASISSNVVPEGHVIVPKLSPATILHVHGVNIAVFGHCALYITPSTRIEISFWSVGKFLGGCDADGVCLQWLRRTFVNTLKPVKKLKSKCFKLKSWMVILVHVAADWVNAALSICYNKTTKTVIYS